MKIEDLFPLVYSEKFQPPTTNNLPIQEHIRFMWSFPKVHNAKLETSNEGRKSAPLSALSKRLGNEAYKRADYRSALAHYNQAILHAPPADLGPLSLAYGNRSAALHETASYKKCLKDIKKAIDCGYPTEKRLKLCERRAACFKALGDNVRAATSYQHAIENFQGKEELKDIEQKLASLDMTAKKKFKNKFYEEKNPWKPVPSVADGTNTEIAGLSSSVELKVNDSRGRHYIAKRDIEPGEVILVEKPYIYRVDYEKYLTYCTNCLKRFPTAPMPCRSCSLVIYCSDQCEEEAWNAFHRLECQIMPNLKVMYEFMMRQVGIANIRANPGIIIFPLALRILMKAGAKALCEAYLQDQGKVDFKVNTTGDGFESSSYEALKKLSWRDVDRTKTAQNAVVTLKLLQLTSFFDEFAHEHDLATKKKGDKGSKVASQEKAKQMREFEVYVGATLHLLHLICKQNTIGMDEWELSETPGGFLGAAMASMGASPDLNKLHLGDCIYVHGSLFNHSCYPNVDRFFHGPTGVFRSIRSVKQGEELCIAFCCQYDLEPLPYRAAVLSKGYGFVCRCIACVERWPMRVPTSMQKIYCSGCKTPLSATAETCHACGEVHPISASRVVFHPTAPARVAYKRAVDERIRTGVYSAELLVTSIAFLKKLEAHMVPPCDMILDTVNTMERCYIVQSNCYDMRRSR